MKQAWYHCGRCGAVFESSVAVDEGRLCTECGRKPATTVWPINVEPPVVQENNLMAFGNKGEAVDEGGQRAVRKRRSKNIMMRVVLVWLVLMLAAVWVRSHGKRLADDKEAILRGAGQNNLAAGTMADERVALLSRALPECHRALSGFLSGGTPEIRNQFVANPIATAGKMAVFYQSNAFPSVEVEDLKRVGHNIIRVGDEWMIETRWQGADGVEFDAVFRRYGIAWKLDWEHFSRYGEYSWPLFLAGQGPDEAEFRLLVRKVAVGDQAERSGSRLRFALLTPEFGKPQETGMESPDFVVDRRSDEGMLLEAAFDAKAAGRHLFGGVLTPMEPEGLARVRVRIKRGELGGLRSFTLEKVTACHWLGTDLPGIDIKTLKDDLFGKD